MCGKMKTFSRSLYVLFAILASSTLAALPERIDEDQITPEAFFRAFGQFIQLEDGNFTEEMGRVLIEKTESGFLIGFYRPDAGSFVRIGDPVAVEQTNSPHVSNLSDLGVPCIKAIKKDGSGTIWAYVFRGEVHRQENT